MEEIEQPKLKPEIKQKWIKALRSGEYQQTKGRLKRDDGFCCLGVLCDVYDPSGWVNDQPKRDYNRGDYYYDYEINNSLREASVIPKEMEKDIFESNNLLYNPAVRIKDLPENIRKKVIQKCTEESEEHLSEEDMIEETLSLTDLNDSMNLSFNEIADVIETCM